MDSLQRAISVERSGEISNGVAVLNGAAAVIPFSILAVSNAVPPAIQLRRDKLEHLDFFNSQRRFAVVRRIVMVLVLFAYSVSGALLFYNLESGNEIETLAKRRGDLINEIHVNVGRLKKLLLKDQSQDAEKFITNLYVSMLQIDGRYDLSTFDKHPSDSEDRRLTWSFSSALFFSVTVFSTIGYGSITPITNLGKAAVMVYAVICLPMSMIFIHDYGKLALRALNAAYRFIRKRIRRCPSKAEGDDVSVPIPICLLLSVSIFVLAGVIVFLADRWAGPEEYAMDIWHALYFAYISITTIGFGDLMPGNATFSPMLALLFFLTFPLLRALHGTALGAIESRIVNAFEPKAPKQIEDGR